MARNNAEATANWDFSEKVWKIVPSIAREAEIKSGGLVSADDVEQELYLWLALRKTEREAWEAGHSRTLARNISREAQNLVNRERNRSEREVLSLDRDWLDDKEGWD